MFVGINIGTSGVRACAVDLDSVIRSLAEPTLLLPIIDGNAIEEDPALWWNATLSAVRKLGVKVALGSLKRIAVDGTSKILLIVEEDGRPRSSGMI